MAKLFFIRCQNEEEVKTEVGVPTPLEKTVNIAPMRCDLDRCRSTEVTGVSPRASSDDRAYESDAVCLGCKKRTGLLRYEVDTIFGIKEDTAVLYGRPRVY